MADEKTLTDKQESFCQSYLIDFNGARAARVAGYAEDSANVEASRLLTNANIQARIHELRITMGRNYNVTRERIAQELALIAFGDTKILFDENGGLKSPSNWSDEGRIISSYEESVTEFGDEKTGGTKTTKKVRQWEKTKAIEQLTRMMGYNAPDKVATTDTEGNSVPVPKPYTPQEMIEMLKKINGTTPSG